jgi:hypothetical protein
MILFKKIYNFFDYPVPPFPTPQKNPTLWVHHWISWVGTKTKAFPNIPKNLRGK